MEKAGFDGGAVGLPGNFLTVAPSPGPWTADKGIVCCPSPGRAARCQTAHHSLEMAAKALAPL